MDIDHTEFWKELDVNIGDGPTWFELQKVFARCRTWSYDKKKMVGLLFILSVGIYGIHRQSRIPLMAAKRVLDPEAFEKYPWGRESFRELIISIKVASLKGYTYVVHGCVHALLIWAYESVPILGEKFGKRKETVEIPLLRWGSSKMHYINFDDVLEEEKKTTKDNKIRVRHLLPKPLDEIYPVWLDETYDKKLDNMIRDILDGNLDESFWNISKAAVKIPKGKMAIQKRVHDLVNKMESPKKAKKAHKESHKIEMSINLFEVKKEIGGRNNDKCCERLDSTEKSDRIVKLLENLLNKVDMLDRNIRDRFTVIENHFQRTQSRVSRLEEEMEIYKNQPQVEDMVDSE